MNEIKKRKTEHLSKFYSLLENNDYFIQMLDMFPYMIEIFDSDGTVIYANRKFYESYNIAKPQEYIGYYNILEDKYMLEDLGMESNIRRIFNGETVTIENFKTPLSYPIHKRFVRIKETIDEVMNHNIVGFSIFDEYNKVAFVIVTSQITNIYNGKKEIIHAQEYINENWFEEFSLDSIADTIGLSVAQFCRLFKKHTGNTPYEYYKHLKINKLKEKLCDPNKTIADAFSACGLDYNGRYKQFFKEIVGMTPYEYQQEQSTKIKG